MRRLAAAVIDGVMVLPGLGVFGVAAWIAGSAFGDGVFLWFTAIAALIFQSLFYGLMRVLGMYETAGMLWMEMRLAQLTVQGSMVVVVPFVLCRPG